MKRKQYLIIAILLILSVGMAIAAWHYWTVRPLKLNKQPFTYISDSSRPLPKLPDSYALAYTNTDPQAFPAQYFLTSRSSSQVQSDARAVCALYGFKIAPTINGDGDTIENGVRFKNTTIQCYKDNDGWQFDVETFKNIGDFKRLDPEAKIPQSISKSSKFTNLIIVSIGPPVCYGLSPCKL